VEQEAGAVERVKRDVDNLLLAPHVFLGQGAAVLGRPRRKLFRLNVEDEKLTTTGVEFLVLLVLKK
jgi:hypothetical protein